MNVTEVITLLKNEAEPDFILKMQHFGVDTTTALGIRIPSTRKIAKQLNGIAKDAIRELNNEKIIKDIEKNEKK